MSSREENSRNVVVPAVVGTVWFAGLGAVGAMGALADDPAHLASSVAVAAMGLLGASVFVAILRVLMRPESGTSAAGADAVVPASGVESPRRGVSKAA